MHAWQTPHSRFWQCASRRRAHTSQQESDHSCLLSESNNSRHCGGMRTAATENGLSSVAFRRHGNLLAVPSHWHTVACAVPKRESWRRTTIRNRCERPQQYELIVRVCSSARRCCCKRTTAPAGRVIWLRTMHEQIGMKRNVTCRHRIDIELSSAFVKKWC